MARQTNTVAIIVILALTIAAFGFLLYHSFGGGSVAGTRKATPSSLQPTAVATRNATLQAYASTDVPENHYSIQVPSSWTLNASSAGAYAFILGDATASVKLTDIPDNSNLILYVLSQVEPRLRTDTPGYAEIGQANTTVNGAEAYRLTYRSSSGGASRLTTQVFITGADQAALITVSAPEDAYSALQPSFDRFIASFSWRNP